jgi:V/A-type H+-transporting ATPase subunit K
MNSIFNDPQLAYHLSKFGAYLAVGLAAFGSMIGCCHAGAAALGCWKRAYQENKPAAFVLSIFAGAPLSQTIYAMILLMMLTGKSTPEDPVLISHFLMGLFGGILLLAAAIYQGKIGAVACDMYSSTNKGFGNAITVVGIVETVGLFAIIFAAMAI